MGRAILIIGGAALLLGVWIYSILDAAQTDRLRVRTLPKGAWLAVLVLFPLLGSVLWFWLGGRVGRATGLLGRLLPSRRWLPMITLSF